MGLSWVSHSTLRVNSLFHHLCRVISLFSFANKFSTELGEIFVSFWRHHGKSLREEMYLFANILAFRVYSFKRTRLSKTTEFLDGKCSF